MSEKLWDWHASGLRVCVVDWPFVGKVDAYALAGLVILPAPIPGVGFYTKCAIIGLFFLFFCFLGWRRLTVAMLWRRFRRKLYAPSGVRRARRFKRTFA